MNNAIPNGYHTLTPSFTFKDSRKAIEFYKNAFNARVIDLLPGLDGSGVMHATMQIGTSILMMGDEHPDPNCGKSAETLGNSPITLFLYVEDVDKTFTDAINAGATSVMPVAEMFWGDRCGTLKDPFGYSWMIATHKKDLNQQEIQEGAKAFFAQMSKS